MIEAERAKQLGISVGSDIGDYAVHAIAPAIVATGHSFAGAAAGLAAVLGTSPFANVDGLSAFSDQQFEEAQQQLDTVVPLISRDA